MKKEVKVEVSDSVVRLLEFVEQHGGPSKVAERLGKSPQIFYNYRKGLSKPGTDVYKEIYEKYPDFDANYILFGKRQPVMSQGVDEKEYRHVVEKLSLYQALVKQMGIEVGKDKVVTNARYLVDQEGASDSLLDVIVANIFTALGYNTGYNHLAQG